MAVLKYKNPDTGEWEAIPHIVQGSSGDGYELTDEDKNEIAGLVEAVSYSQTQTLTPEQKETARNNINAVDASRVVNLLTGNEQIPTAAALDGYINSWTQDYCVRYDADPHYLPEEYKARARNNIGAVDASLVVDNIVADNKILKDCIPNGTATFTFLKEHGVSTGIVQSLSESHKARARTNIGAVSQTEFDETIGNINSILATVVSGGVS